MKVLASILVLGIRLYQWTVSPLFSCLCGGCGCRFAPSCSHYAAEALQRHGPAAGSWLALRRLARCHPWGGSGPDPVPATPGKPSSHSILTAASAAPSSQSPFFTHGS